MNIGIIGAGVSGVYLALLLKKRDENLKVTLIDVFDKPDKKLLITGNGRANIGNKVLKENSYNNETVTKIVKDYPIGEQIKFLNSIGVEVSTIGDLYYPYSFSANQLQNYLAMFLKEKGVKCFLNYDVKEYEVRNDKEIIVRTPKKDFIFDKLVIASGGMVPISEKVKSTNLVTILKKHGYNFTELKPGLTPIRTFDNTKPIENLRVKCLMRVLVGEKERYSEEGEVLFKKDGLSGICIFNASSIIKRNNLQNVRISLDLMPHLNDEQLLEKLEKYNQLAKFSCLDGIFDEKLAEYIRKKADCKNLYKFTKPELRKIAKTIKNLKFVYNDNYEFSNAQVTIGGLDFNEVNIKNLESVKEKNVYFVGEILDADGLCGGYNIMFAHASAYRVYKDLMIG